jgi:4-hydroxy-tetrahydrodipicolinate synthase
MLTFDETSSGVYVIAVTPFTDTGALDLEATDRLVDFYLGHGVTGLTILGMMGEAPKLSGAESRVFTQKVCQRVAGRVPVVVGVSSPGFASMGELTQVAMDAGAAGVMVAPPHTLRSDKQIVDYFTQVAETLGAVPFVLQDFPLVTNVPIPVSVMKAIIAAVPSCVMLKHEDWPGLGKISALRAGRADTERRISILVGNGGVFLPEELARGADGAMTGFAFPEMMVRVCALHTQGEVDKAADLFDAYLPLVRYEQQPGIGLAVRKYVLHQRGVLNASFIRKPGNGLSGLEIAEVKRLIDRQNHRLAELT